MALTATIFKFTIELSDVDRGVYDTFELRAAQHPSESDGYLVTRVIAWALEQAQDLQMGRGIAFPDEPAISITDPTGAIQRWIEVGVPGAEHLHRATKRAPQVVIYAHRSIQPLLNELKQKQVHKQDTVQVYCMQANFLKELEGTLSRNNHWAILRSDDTLYITIGDETFTSPLPQWSIEALMTQGTN